MKNRILNLIHLFYVGFGRILCRLHLFYCNIRDYIFPPKEEAVLFVAHPDDDVLFFHSFLKEKQPYVVLMTTGWSFRSRVPDFKEAMKKYGVRYRMYSLDANTGTVEKLTAIAGKVQKIGKFSTVATHNPAGEYGHIMHSKVNQAVSAVFGQDILVPDTAEAIVSYPLNGDDVREKAFFFEKIYTTETFCMEQYSLWFTHEHLIFQSQFPTADAQTERNH